MNDKIKKLYFEQSEQISEAGALEVERIMNRINSNFFEIKFFYPTRKLMQLFIESMHHKSSALLMMSELYSEDDIRDIMCTHVDDFCGIMYCLNKHKNELNMEDAETLYNLHNYIHNAVEEIVSLCTIEIDPEDDL